jgi:hypothetical protein
MHLIIFDETPTIYMLSKYVQSGATRVWHTHKHPMQRTSRTCTKIVTRLRQTTEENEPQNTPTFFIVIGFKIVSFHEASLASTNRIPVRHSARPHPSASARRRMYRKSPVYQLKMCI